jgi:hypothetical protein
VWKGTKSGVASGKKWVEGKSEKLRKVVFEGGLRDGGGLFVGRRGLESRVARAVCEVEEGEGAGRGWIGEKV